MSGRIRRQGRRLRAGAIAALGALALLATDASADTPGRIERVEVAPDGTATKVVVHLSRPIAFHARMLDGDAAQKTRRLVLDFGDTTLGPAATKPVAGSGALVRQVRTGQFDARTARVVVELASEATHTIDAVETPPSVTIALAGPGAPPLPAPAEASAPAAPAAAAVEEPKPAAAAATTKQPVRTIPIRARGRRPYSLNYAR